MLRFQSYPSINGLIIIFNKDGISKKSKTIKGYYYDPASKKFIKGTFPYPSSIFSVIPLNKRDYSHLRKNIGNTIFNYPFRNFDKLTFWKMTSQIPRLKNHIPETRALRSKDTILQMLSKDRAMYLKPSKTSQGRGIYHLKMDKMQFVLTDNEGNRKYYSSLDQFINKFQKRSYLIQEEVLIRKKDRKIDFRVYMQKGLNKKWKQTAMEARVAKQDSIITNSSGRDKVLPGSTAMEKLYGLSKKDIQKKAEEITSLCAKILSLIEKKGHHLGDVAFDFILDEDNKVWLLEIQVNYASDKKIFWTRDDHAVLPHILPTPLEYAKVLAGF
nr:YheC/YheD family protein [Alteribacter salitolerans]